MAKRLFIIVAALLVSAATIRAQTVEGRKVSQVTLRNSKNQPVEIPHFGEKNLLIFYPDPDAYLQNRAFTDKLEDDQTPDDRFYGFGVVNLPDSFMPNGILRRIIDAKVRKTGAEILLDPDYALRDSWGLGELNNQFSIIIVSKDCRILYFRKGKLSEKDQADYFAVLDSLAK